ncbi:hypothetical protein pb186bvf_002156 [Paramecium bursaria]
MIYENIMPCFGIDVQTGQYLNRENIMILQVWKTLIIFQLQKSFLIQLSNAFIQLLKVKHTNPFICIIRAVGINSQKFFKHMQCMVISTHFIQGKCFKIL